MAERLHVSVRDPPSTLRPPPVGFHYDSPLIVDSPEASVGFPFPKINATPKASSIPRRTLSKPIEYIAQRDTPDIARLASAEKSSSKGGESRNRTKSTGKMGIELKLPLKKRRSLHSIIIPSFLQSQPPPTPTHPSAAASSFSRRRSQSAPKRPGSSSSSSTTPSSIAALPRSKSKLTPEDSRCNSPSPFLDDDPFANISGPPSAVPPGESFGEVAVTPPTPPAEGTATRSPPASIPTSPTKSETTIPPLPLIPFPPPVDVPNLSRPKSSGSGQVRPAYMKPAFTPRPSLPSLHTLAQMNVVVHKKPRRGTVGARLPHEPWNMDLSAEDSPLSSPPSGSGTSTPRSPAAHKPRMPSVADFTLALGEEVVEFSSDQIEEEDEHDEVDPDLYSHISTDYPPSLSFTPTDPSSYSLSRSSSLASYTSSQWPADDLKAGSISHSTSSSSLSDLGEPSNDYFGGFTDDDPLQLDEHLVDYYRPVSPTDATLQLPDVKSRLRSRSPSPIPNMRTPHSSFYHPTEESLDMVENASYSPSTSASTVRSSLHDLMSGCRPDSSLLPERPSMDYEAVDGSGWDGRYENGRGGYRDDWDYRRGDGGAGGGGRSNGGSGGGDRRDGNFTGNGSGSGGGDRDRDGDDRRNRRPAQSSFSNLSDEEESEEESTDDYGMEETLPSKKVKSPSSGLRPPPVPDSPSANSTTTDDDVPLAKKIPSALRAQKSIRKQVRDERDQRRREKADVRGRVSTSSNRTANMAQPQELSSSQEAALHASKSMTRQRTKTMPSNTQRPFAVDDLTQKLLSVQAAGLPPAAIAPPRIPQGRVPGMQQEEYNRRFLSNQPVGSPAAVASHLRPRSSQGRDQQQGPSLSPMDSSAREPSFEVITREKVLRPMRSLRALSSKAAEGSSTAYEDNNYGQKIGRSSTSARPRRHEESPVGASRSNRASEETRRPSIGGSHTGRPSGEIDAGGLQRNNTRPPMPPLPAAEVLNIMAHTPAPKIQMTQQRIFIEDKQRYQMVEVSASTNAGEVVEMVDSQASLNKLGAGVGGWMLWEVAQDFGMERPIREYELLSDVEASWNKDKMVNIFVIKKTPLAPILDRKAIPPASPRSKGYVEWEQKRGKWSKRWMELREHSLWLAKRDTGKDETFLCSLSNFDVYYVGKAHHKSPKPFVFAVKSTDNLSLFESATDYVHFFSCNQKEGETWMQAILLARSYVLFQERNVLFAPKTTLAPSTSKSLSRSGTRKTSSATRVQPAQPLVNVTAPLAVALPKIDFEAGSLLAKRGDHL